MLESGYKVDCKICHIPILKSYTVIHFTINMKGAKSTIIAGVLCMVFGNIFNLQGNSILGPQSSFMYANPDWVSYGTYLVILGAIIFGAGIILCMIKN